MSIDDSMGFRLEPARVRHGDGVEIEALRSEFTNDGMTGAYDRFAFAVHTARRVAEPPIAAERTKAGLRSS
jgi:hypothetical protein